MRFFFLVRTPTKAGHEGKWGCRSIGDGTTKDMEEEENQDASGKVKPGKRERKGHKRGYSHVNCCCLCASESHISVCLILLLN